MPGMHVVTESPDAEDVEQLIVRQPARKAAVERFKTYGPAFFVWEFFLINIARIPKLYSH